MIDKKKELFSRLYHENRDKVYRLALGLTADPHDAEEITQEAFLRAFRSYDSFRAESTFFTWIYRITLNTANDFLKRRAKPLFYTLTEDMGYLIEELTDPNPLNNPETALLAKEIQYKCLHCLTECLSLNQRKVFCLAITLGLPYKQVADIMDCSVGSVKTTLFRAKRRIAGFLEENCQHIKKTNPCNCYLWVQYAKGHGWDIRTSQTKPPLNMRFKDEIIRMRNLRDIYRNLYPETADESLARRIKNGMLNNEWNLFL